MNGQFVRGYEFIGLFICWIKIHSWHNYFIDDDLPMGSACAHVPAIEALKIRSTWASGQVEIRESKNFWKKNHNI